MSPNQALDMAAKAQALHIFEGGALIWIDQDQAAIDAEILAFFRSHAR